MDKKYKTTIKQAGIWALAIFIAWLFGTHVFWNLLDFLIPYEVIAYQEKIALFGTIFFAVISIFLSAVRDRVQLIRIGLIFPIDNIEKESENIFVELSVFIFRIILAGYISAYWFKHGEYLQNQQYMTVNSNLFLLLFLLGAGAMVVIAFSSYMIILEPWRAFLVNTDSYKSVKKLFLSRCLSLMFVSLLFWFYFLPGLITKLPAFLLVVFTLIVITKFQITYFNIMRQARN